MSGSPDPVKLTIGIVAEHLDCMDRYGPGMDLLQPPNVQIKVRRYRKRLSAGAEYGRLGDWIATTLGVQISSDAINQVTARLTAITRQPIDFVRSMSVTDALKVLSAPPPTDGGRQGRAAEREQEGKSSRPLDPVARAVAAAYARKKSGKTISIRAVCQDTGVDRNHLSKKYPEIIELIEKLAEPDSTPPKGGIDRKTGNLDSWEEDDPEND